MKIAVIGGGNIGTLPAAELALENEVVLYTNNISKNKEISVFNQEDILLYKAEISIITNDMKEALKDAKVVFCTIPSNGIPDVIQEIGKHIQPNTILIFMPGTGGKEYISKKFINKDITLAGLERVFSIARIKEKGKSVYMLGKKDKLYVSAFPRAREDEVVEIIEKLLKIPCTKVKNYLAVTLTPSNPILHTARIYSMFKDNEKFEKEILFYEEWDKESAKILFECDRELQEICKAMVKLNLQEVVSLKKYYESEKEEQFVNKIKSIKSFKGIKTPMIKNQDFYYPDYNSRYFTEDFPFGLLIIKGFGSICGINTPNIDKIIEWFQKVKKKEYIINGELKGKDIHETGIPQNYGINTIEDIYNFYM